MGARVCICVNAVVGGGGLLIKSSQALFKIPQSKQRPRLQLYLTSSSTTRPHRTPNKPLRAPVMLPSALLLAAVMHAITPPPPPRTPDAEGPTAAA